MLEYERESVFLETIMDREVQGADSFPVFGCNGDRLILYDKSVGHAGVKQTILFS